MDIKFTDSKLSLVNGDLQLTESYIDSVSQRLYIRLKTTYGKWFLNTNYGIDYFNRIFGKVVDKNKIDLIISNEILKEQKVERLLSFSSNIDNKTRVYSCNFSVKVVGITSPVVLKVITTSTGLALLTENNKNIVV